ncbi:NAD(P)H-binding protein [Streptomyces sp. S4.7]|uniref:SDR family oxidoreductase n=1 Tax=Streptomyces sp. S4.7 TaxID=2705439 RepID=UPI0031BA1A29
MSEHPILVTGATGKSGRRVVSQLRARGLPVRAAARNGEHVFDWTDSRTWNSALEGVRSLYIVQLDGTKLVRPFVERAVRHGARRIVPASGRGIDDPDYAKDSGGVLDGVLDSEAAVRESGLEWTISRPGWFAQNSSEGFFADAVRAGELRLPAGRRGRQLRRRRGHRRGGGRRADGGRTRGPDLRALRSPGGDAGRGSRHDLHGRGPRNPLRTRSRWPSTWRTSSTRDCHRRTPKPSRT